MPTQAEKELIHRLLKQLPVRVLRENFTVTGSAQDDMIAQILAGNTLDALKKFYFDNFNHTKQHIYIFKLDRRFQTTHFTASAFPYEIEYEKTITGVKCFYCLPMVTFSATSLHPLGQVTMQFYQPVQVYISGDILRIHFTILEKNLQTYFPNSPIVKVSRDLDEDYFKGEIIGGFPALRVVKCDLNKGVKHLWNTGVIDGKTVRFFKSDSTCQEAMNQNKLLKTVYPDVFAKLMQGPISKTVMKYVLDDDNFCDIFTVDPTEGQINFSNYPLDSNQINNVVATILQHN